MSVGSRKITVITPCLNAEKQIRETIESILGQTAIASGRAELEYIICDGGSTDNTPMILSEYGHNLKVLSKKDNGMYEALSRGLAIATGSICAYLNAGDYYHKCAFDVVLDIFEQKGVQWLTGYLVGYNEKSCVIDVGLPFRYRRCLFPYGVYGRILPHIIQEATFWSAELNQHLDLGKLSSLKLAGDYYLWLVFSRHTDLHIVSSLIGGFKHHRGQLSESRDDYLREMNTFVKRPSLFVRALSLFDQIVWKMPRRVKKRLNPHGLFIYDIKKGTWE